MKIIVSVIYATWFMAAFIAADTAWAVPQGINYQGKVTNDSVPLNGTVAVIFRVLEEETGGVPLWEETQSSVVVTGGLYHVVLGSGVVNKNYGSLGSALSSGDRLWLEVDLNGEVLVPRQRLASVAFSIRGGDADRVGGFEQTQLAENVHEHDFSILGGTVTDTQVPDDLSIKHAGDTLLLEGKEANTFSPAVHFHSGNEVNSGEISAAFMDSALTTDLELAKGLARKADAAHTHDMLYYTLSQVDTIFVDLDARLTTLEEKLDSFSVSDDGRQLFFSGVNVSINSGSATTFGTVNGLGNLIVGYNEERGTDDERGGSHNVIVGVRQNYSAYGGLIAGYQNTISGNYASVSGGKENIADGWYSGIKGGNRNEATGSRASVSGGRYNTASGSYTGVSGGYSNSAIASDASVAGGRFNTASAQYASISGGRNNMASGWDSAVSGGAYNTVYNEYCSISGGRNNKAMGIAASVSGGGGENAQDGNVAVAHYSSVLGGLNSLAGDGTLKYDEALGRDVYSAGKDYNIGYCSVLTGGQLNQVKTSYSSITGGSYNSVKISDDIYKGAYSSISGGSRNVIQASWAGISGGKLNKVTDSYGSVTGGHMNDAAGFHTSVIGGESNTVSGAIGVVTAGKSNDNSGSLSSITGGENNYCSSLGYDTAAISGGSTNEVQGEGSISGGYRNLVIAGQWGHDSSISGGYDNRLKYCSNAVVSGGNEAYFSIYIGEKTCADHTVISGGANNSASGDFSSVSGGLEGSVVNGYRYSVISGGAFNKTYYDYSAVQGGYQNTAKAVSSTVSGGSQRETSTENAWRAGGLYELW